MIDKWIRTTEYKAIKDLYQERTAKRSGVKLMNHIDEGLVILEKIGASDRAALGFCLHPLVQNSEQHEETIANNRMANCLNGAINAAYDYADKANTYLCRPETDDWSLQDIRENLLPLSNDVRDMLIADKVQNQKDFMIHHFGKHERSDQLNTYFNKWITFLSDLYGKHLREIDFFSAK